MSTTVVTSSGFSLFLREMDLKQFVDTVKSMLNDANKGILTNEQRLAFLSEVNDIFKMPDFPPTRHLGEWFIKQMREVKPLNSLKFGLIEDTVNYIKTGYRRLPLAMYADLDDQSSFDEQHKGSQSVSVSVQQKEREKLSRRNVIADIEEMGDNLLYRWVKTEEGFVDFLTFLKYLCIRDFEKH